MGVGAVAHAAEKSAARRSASAGLTKGDYVIIAAVSETVETHRFEVAATWSGDGAGMGRVSTSDGALGVPVAGAVVLGGSGGKANPEELFLAAIASCFVNTWAIFLKKLALGYSEPSLKVEGQLEKDPAGGFRFQRAVIHARVPAALLESRREQVEKTVSLAEKYCIISKAARAAMPVEVRIEAA